MTMYTFNMSKNANNISGKNEFLLSNNLCTMLKGVRHSPGKANDWRIAFFYLLFTS